MHILPAVRVACLEHPEGTTLPAMQQRLEITQVLCQVHVVLFKLCEVYQVRLGYSRTQDRVRLAELLMGEVLFHRPMHVGFAVDCRAQVEDAGARCAREHPHPRHVAPRDPYQIDLLRRDVQ